MFQQIAEALRIIQRPAGGFGKIHSCKGFFFRKSAWEKREIIVCFSKGYFFYYIKGNFVSLGGVTSPVLTESVLHYIFFRFQKTKYQMEAWIGQKIPDVKQFSENIIRMPLFGGFLGRQDLPGIGIYITEPFDGGYGIDDGYIIILKKGRELALKGVKTSALYLEYFTVAAGIGYEASNGDFVAFGTGKVIVLEHGMNALFSKSADAVGVLHTEHLPVAGLPEEGGVRWTQIVIELDVIFFHRVIIAIIKENMKIVRGV